MTGPVGQTMDFFGHQDAARRATRRLVVYFAAAVVLIVAAVYFAAAVSFRLFAGADGLWNPGLLALVTLGVLVVTGGATWFRTSQLRQGGPVVADMLGGTEIGHDSKEHLHQRLLNVVEEMSLASGVPVPRVYVLEQESGINAFAAGWGTRDAVVAVTRGALEQLDRDQLQGVIAHEFSHVFHGDMRMNIRLMGILFGIVCLATTGEILLRTMGRTRSRGSDKNPAAALALFGLFLLLIGWIGAFFAGLIKAAVSRQREYLADASAVAYTRNPLGIGTALARIGDLGSRIARPGAREASHMFFADGFGHWFRGLGATHPPIEKRVERVLPGYLRARARGEPPPAVPSAAGSTAAGPAAAAGVAAFAGGGAIVGDRTVTAAVGQTNAEMVQQSRELMEQLPLEVLAAARDPARAPALARAMLLDPTDDRQLALLADRELADHARMLALELRAVPRTARLPVLELAMPALRRLDPAGRERLHRDFDALARADGSLTTFEFALLHTARRHLPLASEPPPAPRRALALTSAAAEVQLVLSVIAHAGGATSDAAAAFARGTQQLTDMPNLQLLARGQCAFQAVERAMDRLGQLSPMGKKLLLQACVAVAAADGHVASNEGELLRAFAESWDCPLPPLWTEVPAESR